MRAGFVVALLVIGVVSHADEIAPKGADRPQSVLQEARKDFRSGRYPEALDKYLWFHKKSVSIDPGLSAVRLSFALSYWKELADKYPPAMEKLREVRDEAVKRVLKDEDTFSSFQEMEAINRIIDADPLTRDIFETLSETNPTQAKIAFGVAKPALIRGRRVRLLSRYTDPDADFKRSLDNYSRLTKDARQVQGAARMQDYARKRFANEVTTLVAILAIDGRKEKAKEVASLAREKLDDDEFSASLNEALQGVLPDPWP